MSIEKHPHNFFSVTESGGNKAVVDMFGVLRALQVDGVGWNRKYQGDIGVGMRLIWEGLGSACAIAATIPVDAINAVISDAVNH